MPTNLERPIVPPVLEAERPAEDVLVPGAISGQQVIDDLANRIAERLATSCNLRATDCYSSYAARVHIELQLIDITPVDTVVTDVLAGVLNPRLPSQHLDLHAAVDAEEPAPSLEVNVDGSPLEASAAAPAAKRFYTARGSKPVPLKIG